MHGEIVKALKIENHIWPGGRVIRKNEVTADTMLRNSKKLSGLSK